MTASLRHPLIMDGTLRRTHRTPTSAGHRLRLQIASSDYPLYVPHPGTSESPWFAVETAVNHQRVLTGGPTPSYVSVTLLVGLAAA